MIAHKKHHKIIARPVHLKTLVTSPVYRRAFIRPACIRNVFHYEFSIPLFFIRKVLESDLHISNIPRFYPSGRVCGFQRVEWWWLSCCFDWTKSASTCTSITHQHDCSRGRSFPAAPTFSNIWTARFLIRDIECVWRRFFSLTDLLYTIATRG